MLTAVPSPLARWTFDSDARAVVGLMHGTLEGGATVSNGRLHLDGKGAFFRSAPLPKGVREKTLEVWLTLSNLTQQGGGSISVENSQGSNFDAISSGIPSSRAQERSPLTLPSPQWGEGRRSSTYLFGSP